MNTYRVETSKNHIIDVEAKNPDAAKEIVQGLVSDKVTPVEGKVVNVSEVTPEKPDNTVVSENGGYTFTAWGIHVAAANEAAAKKVVKEAYGINVDKDTPPPAAQVEAGQQ